MSLFEIRHPLFWAHNFPLYRLVVVSSSTCWAKAVHIVLDVVETELADL